MSDIDQRETSTGIAGLDTLGFIDCFPEKIQSEVVV